MELSTMKPRTRDNKKIPARDGTATGARKRFNLWEILTETRTEDKHIWKDKPLLTT